MALQAPFNGKLTISRRSSVQAKAVLMIRRKASRRPKVGLGDRVSTELRLTERGRAAKGLVFYLR